MQRWRRASPRAVGIAAALACALSPAAATAQPPETLDKELCVTSYERAQIQLRQRKLVDAGKELEVCRARCPGVLQHDCETWSASQEQALPTVVLQARDVAGRDLVEVRIALDGQPLADRLDGEPRAVDPGDHTFRFAPSDGRTACEVRVTLVEGEKRRAVAVVFPLAAAVAPPVAPAMPERRTEAGARRMPTLGYVFGGVGLGALALGGALAVSGEAKRADLQSTCGASGTCPHDEVQAIRNEWAVAGATLGASAVLLSVATAFYLTTPRAVPRGAFPSSVTIAIAPTRIAMSGSF